MSWLQVCECKEGLEYIPYSNGTGGGSDPNDESSVGGCMLKIKSTCGQDYNSAFEFDPLRDLKRFSPPYSPECVPGSTCQTVPLFFTKLCRCTPSPTNNCSGEVETKYRKTLSMVDLYLDLA